MVIELLRMGIEAFAAGSGDNSHVDVQFRIVADPVRPLPRKANRPLGTSAYGKYINRLQPIR